MVRSWLSNSNHGPRLDGKDAPPFHWFLTTNCIHAGRHLVTLMVVSQQNMATCRSSLIEEHEFCRSFFECFVPSLSLLMSRVWYICRCFCHVFDIFVRRPVTVIGISGQCIVSRWSVRCCTELDRRKCSLCKAVKWGPSCGPCELSSSVQLCPELSGLLM